MARPFQTIVCAFKRSCARSRPHRAAVAAVSGLGIAAIALVAALSPASAAGTCTLNATPSNFAAQVSAAAAGQTICLASGDYGSWRGTNKAITVTAASGNTPTMRVSFASGASGFTLDGMSGMSGTIDSGAANLTIQDSTFVSQLDIEGSPTNVVINNNNFTYPVQSVQGGPNSKIFLDTNGALPGSAVTIENNDIENGDLDGINVSGGSGDLIYHNHFANLCDRNVNHTDNIQFEGGTQIAVAGNYVYEPQNCPTQGITSYDGNTNGLIIEDNVVDVPRDWGIELYSDQNSIVVHNTVVYHPKTYSEFNTGTGRIALDRKSQDPAGSGTQVYDNIATSVDISDGSTGSKWDNVSGQTAIYVGPTNTWAGFKLAPNSPVGLRAASDGLDDGARIASPPQSPPPPPPPPGSGTTPGGGANNAVNRLKVTSFSFSPSKFTAARRGVKNHHHAKWGTLIRFRLSATSNVRIAIVRELSGRRSGGKCVAPTRRLRKHRACMRYVLQGAVVHKGKAGRNTIAFNGILHGHRLKRGHYRATIVATARGRRRSVPRTTRFTVA